MATLDLSTGTQLTLERMSTGYDTSRSDNLRFDNAARRVFETEVTFAGLPEAVFPLLCPVREYDWIDDWSGTMIYSDSGVAELGCIFRTDSETGDELWTVSRYDPCTAISFVRVIAGTWVVLMELTLSLTNEQATTIRVRHTYTTLGPAGRTRIEAIDADEHALGWHHLAEMGNHYLTKTTMLRSRKDKII